MHGAKGRLILDIYHKLYELYGPQGWWPLQELENKYIAKTGAQKGYHPQNYDYPKKDAQRFEIIVGAILTQNTTWLSVVKALNNLINLDALSAEKILQLDVDDLKQAIKCAGFLNQKANYLINISKFFLELDNQIPCRKDLLQVRGVGNETADSILLYAYKQPEFVVDTYTRRIFSRWNLIPEKATYMNIKMLFEANLNKDVPLFQEYHALIVEHAKRYYQKKPYGANDPLGELII